MRKSFSLHTLFVRYEIKRIKLFLGKLLITFGLTLTERSHLQ